MIKLFTTRNSKPTRLTFNETAMLQEILSQQRRVAYVTGLFESMLKERYGPTIKVREDGTIDYDGEPGK